MQTQTMASGQSVTDHLKSLREISCRVGVVELVGTSTILDAKEETVNAPITRQTRAENFLSIARAVAGRADCSRRQVGAVVVKDNRIKSTGYNGSPPGGKSCLAGECPRGLSTVSAGSSYDTGAGTCIALHAEQNALLYASPDDRQGATLYLTDKPCEGCWRMIQGSGIYAVIYGTPEAFHTGYANVDYKWLGGSL